MLSRRSLLTSCAPLAVALPLGACSTTQIQQAQQTITQVIATVQAYAATVCGFLPEAQVIVNLVVAITGQVVVGTVSSVVLQTVEQTICQMVPAPASARYKALPLQGAGAPVVIGTPTVHGQPVPISGWRTR